MHVGVDILNLSIGGPDFADQPFIDKVNELTARGIIVVSAIGNDGPLWGSLNNPADMMEVVGVGGAEPDGSIAHFSSRGMTTHEIGSGRASYGRVKPDLVAYGRSLSGPSHRRVHSCRRLSGTSVASPIVAGAIALIASAVPAERRRSVVNPASVKRALIASSKRLAGSSMYEQGSGLLDIVGAADEMLKIDAEWIAAVSRDDNSRSTFDSSLARPGQGSYGDGVQSDWTSPTDKSLAQWSEKHELLNGTSAGHGRGLSAVLFPGYLDLTSRGCPYMWPHCAQPLFYGMLPICINITILNPGGMKGVVDAAEWIQGRHGHHLRLRASKPERFWPWAGGLGIHLSAAGPQNESIVAEGIVRIRIRSVVEGTYSEVELPIRAEIVPTPLRDKRLLWDIFHSVRYPPSYVPRDNLADTKDMLDWLGDHPHTNYQAFYRRLRLEGYFIDILDVPLTCLAGDAGDTFGALLLFDSEDFFAEDEVSFLERVVKTSGMSVVIAAEWHNEGVMRSLRFEDDNTRSWWEPVVGGGNAPALNELLHPHGVALGELVLSGTVRYKLTRFAFASGNGLVRFPEGGEVKYGTDMSVHERSSTPLSFSAPVSSISREEASRVPILGITRSGRGCIAIYGDSNCIDTAHSGKRCHDMFAELIDSAIGCRYNDRQGKLMPEGTTLKKELVPGKEATRVRASDLSVSARNLLRPHSRTMHASSAPGFPKYKDMARHCSDHFQLTEKLRNVHDDPRVGTRVQLPSVRVAVPVGTSRGYYETVTPSLGVFKSFGRIVVIPN
jgi:membrane-bound transcription factor site-1 protease